MQLVILISYYLRTGVVELSPSAAMDLTCTSSGTAHRWEFTVFPENMVHTVAPVISDGTGGIPPPLTFSGSVITFSRLSSEDVLPLVSRVTIRPVSSGAVVTVLKAYHQLTWWQEPPSES